MKELYISILVLFLNNSLFSQPTIQWEHCFGGTCNSGTGDLAFDVVESLSEGYISVGTTCSTDGNVSGYIGGQSDGWIIKTDLSGNLLWQKCIGTLKNDVLYGAAAMPDGGLVTCGYAGLTVGSHGGYDVIVAKISSSGSLLWQKLYGGSSDDIGYSIQTTTDSGFIIAGQTSSSDGDVSGYHVGMFNDAWLLKLDSLGNIQWQHCYGGSSNDEALCVRQTADKGYIFVGRSRSIDGDVPGGWYTYIPWIVKTDSLGNIQWQKEYGQFSPSFTTNQANSVIQTSDKKYLVACIASANGGDVTGNHGGADYWLLKLDTLGNLLWQKSYGGSGNDGPRSVGETSDRNYFVAGGSDSNDGQVTGNANPGSGNYWVIKTDTSGSIIWTKCLGAEGSDNCMSAKLTSDGGYILTGRSTSASGPNITGNHGGGDFWLVKLAPDIVPLQFGRLNAVQQNQHVQCNWQTYTEQNTKTFIIRRSNDGVHFTSIGSIPAAGNSSLQRNYAFTDQGAANLGYPTLYYRLQMTDKDGSYTYSNIARVSLHDNNNTSVYPNPVADVLQVQILSNQKQAATIYIHDAEGRLVLTRDVMLQPGNNSVPVDVSNFPAGAYLLTVNDERKYTVSFVKR